MRNILQIIDELISMWWKPRGKNDNTFNCSHDKNGTEFVLISDFKESDMFYFKITDLVRRESGFWRFVVDKRLYVKTPGYMNAYQELKSVLWKDKRWPVLNKDSEEYWLIESALRKDNELEDFINRSLMTKDIIRKYVDSYVRWTSSIKEILGMTGWNQIFVENMLRKPKETYLLWSNSSVNLTQQEEQFINTMVSKAIDEIIFRSNAKVTVEKDEI